MQPYKKATRVSQLVSCFDLRTSLTALCSSKPFQLLRSMSVNSVISWGVTALMSCTKSAAGQLWWLRPDLQRASWQLLPKSFWGHWNRLYRSPHTYTHTDNATNALLPLQLSHHDLFFGAKKGRAPLSPEADRFKRSLCYSSGLLNLGSLEVKSHVL